MPDKDILCQISKLLIRDYKDGYPSSQVKNKRKKYKEPRTDNIFIKITQYNKSKVLTIQASFQS